MIHIYLQERGSIEQKKLLPFLNKLLENCSSLAQKYSRLDIKEFKESCNKTNKNGNKTLNRSVNRSSISTRSEDLGVCKEVFLLNSICKPYLAYLMKIMSIFENYRRFEKRTPHFERHEVWMMTNLLRTITSITAQFTNIGRYYMKQFGHLVILLSKTFSRDINNLV